VFFAWQQKVVLKISSMSDERVKQKAMETVADIYGENTSVLRIGVISLHVLICLAYRCYLGKVAELKIKSVS
jgi:hypothetical protein